MNRLLLTLPYCNKDSTLALQLLRWMQELQPTGYKPHSILVAADTEVPVDVRREIFALAKPMFAHAVSIGVPVPPEKQGWIPGSNWMFEKISESISNNTKLPWLWCEPDCVPLREGWLDALAQAYSDCPQKFMGAWVTQSGQEGMPPVHLSGCSIYDAQAYEGMKGFCKGNNAFDIASAQFCVARSVNSNLFQYFWGRHDLSPTFREQKGPEDPENTIPMGWLRKDAALFHRCKDGTLIDCLRKRREAKSKKPKDESRQVILTNPPKVIKGQKEAVAA